MSQGISGRSAASSAASSSSAAASPRRSSSSSSQISSWLSPATTLPRSSAASTTTLALPRPQAISARWRTKSVLKIGLSCFLSRSLGPPASTCRRVSSGRACSFQVPVPLVAFGQPGHALPAAFQRLDVLLAVAACAARPGGPARGRGCRSTGCTVRGAPSRFVALLQQRVLLQGFQGGAADAEFDFGFFLHGAMSGSGRQASAGEGVPDQRRAGWVAYTFRHFHQGGVPCRPIRSSACSAVRRSGRCSNIAKAHECAAGLLPFFRAVIAEDWAQVEQVQQDMVRLEQEADRLKKNVRTCPRACSFRCRAPICWSCSVQDKVANRAATSSG